MTFRKLGEMSCCFGCGSGIMSGLAMMTLRQHGIDPEATIAGMAFVFSIGMAVFGYMLSRRKE